MRILMISDFFKPVTGGVEQLVEALSVALARRGHSVAVATLHTDAGPDYEEQDGIRIYRLKATTQRITGLFKDARRTYAPPWPDPEAVIGLRRVLKSERPHVVHGHNWLTYSVLPVLREHEAKLVLSIHDYAYICPKKTLVFADGTTCSGPGAARCIRCAGAHYGVFKGLPTVIGSRMMNQPLLHAASACLPVSRTVADRSGLRVGQQHPSVSIIPPFIADDLERDADASAVCVHDLPKKPFILFVGQLGRHKGVHTLLEAYAGLEAAPALVLIGSRKEDTPVDLPPNVRMFHDWPHAAVLEAWRRSLFGVVPSLWTEPFGIVSLEAMAFGRALVASRNGGIVDCVEDGVTGLLVTPGHVDGLQSALDRLLAEPELRERLGQAGHRRSLAFRASAIVPRIEAIYEGVCS